MTQDLIIIAHLLDALGAEVNIDVNLTVHENEVNDAINNLDVYIADPNIFDDSEDITRVLTKYNITAKQAMTGLISFAKQSKMQVRFKS